MKFSLLSVPVYFCMSKCMIDCTEKENNLMRVMVKSLGIYSNLSIKKVLECDFYLARRTFPANM